MVVQWYNIAFINIKIKTFDPRSEDVRFSLQYIKATRCVNIDIYFLIFISSAKRRNFALVIHLITELTNKIKTRGMRWIPDETSGTDELKILTNYFLLDRFCLNFKRKKN